jgi:hypothetical protein
MGERSALAPLASRRARGFYEPSGRRSIQGAGREASASLIDRAQGVILVATADPERGRAILTAPGGPERTATRSRCDVRLRPTLCGGLLFVTIFSASRAVAAGPAPAEPELALLYDFQGVEGTTVPDGSGHDRTGRLEGGEIVTGRRKPAVQLDGHGMVTMADVPRDLDLASRALTVGAMCRPAAPDGVIVSMGDAKDGFSLFLRDGVPHFAVRANGSLNEVVASEAVELDQWAHIAGAVDEKGTLKVLVDTWQSTEAQGRPLARTPVEPLTVGADPGSHVGEYSTALPWQGLLQDVRLYLGTLSREANRSLLGDWAQRPGCSCRK